MASDESGERHSIALSPVLITDEDERARKEAQNGLLQADLANRIIDQSLDPDWQPFRLRASIIRQLNHRALDGLDLFAGTYRPSTIEIGQSKHTPPDAFVVDEFVNDMCAYVNENWTTKTAIHLSAYVLWRLNWIHPFTDGNGRTARTASYVVLCAHLGLRLPGSNTIPDQIAADKGPYYKALEEADEAAVGGRIDVSHLEAHLESLLARQLVRVMEAATGKPPSERPSITKPVAAAVGSDGERGPPG
jgi:Fic family protein